LKSGLPARQKKYTMSITEVNNLKYNLIDKLISVRDISLLEKIDNLIGKVDLEQSVFTVSTVQKQMLLNSEDDIRNGRLITNDEVNDEEDLWLND
jgi:hypothetical protein